MTGRNLLVVGPPMSGKRSFGLSVLGDGIANGRDALVVAASRHLAAIPFDHTGGGRFGVVDCTPSDADEDGPVVNVASPGDLTGISMPVSRFLDGSERPVVLFDSISSILQYADEESAFRFLSVLTAQVAGADGVGLYTFDGGAHTEETHRTFAQLFEGRVELRGGTDPASGGRDEGATEVRVSGVAGTAGEWTGI
ncbi:RAD55 family ATPase [Salinirubellus sp. GCM10025818]|uniref:RAD55 family ATPase n=1 Tax=Salinirubellus TaxID=2162630 RepID=UPI0030D57A5E